MFLRSFLLIASFFIFFADYSYASDQVVFSDQAEVRLLAGKYDESGNLDVAVDFKLKPGWKMYWRTAGDAGFPPSIDWSKSSNIKQMDILWPFPERHIDEFDGFKSESYVYHGESVLPLRVSVVDPAKMAEIVVEVNYGICKDICIPATAKFVFAVNPGFYDAGDYEKILAAHARIPKENGEYGLLIGDVTYFNDKDGNTFLNVMAGSKEGFSKDADMFVEAGNDFAFYKPEVIKKGENGLEFRFPVTFLTNDTVFDGKEFVVTLVDNDNAVEFGFDGFVIQKTEAEKTEPVNIPVAAGYSFIVILLFAFIGGLILNIMPCVLPVLSIKILGVIKHGGGHSRNVVLSFIATAIGIIVSFIALATMIIAFRNIGINLGWGFHFQEPVFILFLIVILLFFAASMWDLYQINIPGFICTSDECEKGGAGLKASFLAGILATMLATPCTAPFLGTAVGFALTREAYDILVIFFVMGLGMASPYMFFSIFPKIVTKLPKPGIWMVKFKYFLGVLLAITAIWLIWVLSNPVGVASAVIFIILFTAKMLIPSLGGRRLFAMWIVAVLAGYLFFSLNNHNAASEESGSGVVWHKFEPDKIASLVDSGKIVFVDVTADWCLTCKANKFFVLDNVEVKGLLQLDNVYVMRADWTGKNNDISEYLRGYNRVGIPFNIVYGPDDKDGVILSELLSVKDIREAFKKAGHKASY